MATPRKHIEPTADLIRRYLAGELDDKTMHALERQALEDPFLAEALQGYGKSPHAQEPALNDLRARLQKRLAQPPAASTGIVRRIDRRWLAAASVLLLVAISALFLLNRRPSGQDIAQELPKAPKAQDSITPQAQPAAAQPESAQAVLGNAADAQPEPQAEKNIPAAATQPAIANAPANENAATATENERGKAAAKDELARRKATDDEKVRSHNNRQYALTQKAKSVAPAPALSSAPVPFAPPPPPPAEEKVVVGYASAADKKANVTDTIYIGQKPSPLARKNAGSDEVASKMQGKVAGAESRYFNNQEAHDLRLISGKVLDASTGELMGGAIVHERSTNKRVVTDSAGTFTITVNAAARPSIDVSMLGYKNTVVSVPEDKSTLNIYLPADENKLSEVVILTGGKGRATPQPALGLAAYRQYLDQLPPVPVDGMKDSLSGEIRVTFTVHADGSLHDVKADEPFHPYAGAIAVKRVEEGPKWTPVKGRKGKAEILVPVKLIPMK